MIQGMCNAVLAYRRKGSVPIVCLAVFLLTFTALSFELSLTRFYSFLFSDGLLYFPISIALLGFGLSGLCVYVCRKAVMRYSREVLVCAPVAVSYVLLFFTMITFYLSPAIDQYVSLVRVFCAALYLGVVSGTVFFLIGMCLALIFKSYTESVGTLYCFDLLGAGCGCVATFYLMPYVGPVGINGCVSVLALIAAVCFLVVYRRILSKRVVRVTVWCGVCAALVSGFISVSGMYELAVDPHTAARDYTRERVVEEVWHRWNVYSRVGLLHFDDTETPDYLFSINKDSSHARVMPYDEKTIFQYSMYPGSPVSWGFAAREIDRILIVFAGAGRDMLEAYAYSHGTADIVGVEINPLLVEKALSLPQARLRAFFDKPNVSMIVQEARSYLNRDTSLYDSIVLSWSGASSAYYAGTMGLTNQYLYTREAFVAYIERLTDDGIITIINTNKAKVLSMARFAYEHVGITHCERNVVVLARFDDLTDPTFTHPWEGRVVLLKKSHFTADEVSRIDTFSRQFGYSIVLSPEYVHPSYTLYEEVLTTSDLDTLLRTMSEKENAHFRMATDDHPFVFRMFRAQNFFSLTFWKKFLQLEHDEEALNNGLIIALFLAVIVLLVCSMGLPLLCMTRQFSGFWMYSTYFGLIGAGFMFLEVYFMQVLGLFLGHPAYALICVLAVMLVGAGVGSSYVRRNSAQPPFVRVVAVIVCVLAGMVYGIPWVVEQCIQYSVMVKVLITIVLVVPVSFFLGMLFPRGLQTVAVQDDGAIALAYGINAVASVCGSVAGIVISYYCGFRYLLFTAIGVYVLLFMVSMRISYRVNGSYE